MEDRSYPTSPVHAVYYCLLSLLSHVATSTPVELLLEVSSYLGFVPDLSSLYHCYPILYTLLKDKVDELLKTEQSLQPLVWAVANGIFNINETNSL